MRNNYRSYILPVGLIIFAILPFFVSGFYYRPTADDYLLAYLKNQNGWWGLQRWWYIEWGGRFSSTALIGLINPLNFNNYTLFSFHAPVGIIVFCFLLFVLTRFFLGPMVSNHDILILTASIIIIFFYIAPGLSDGLFWYVGFMVYFLAILLFIIWMMVLIKLIKKENNTLYTSLVLIIGVIIVGFNEVILCITVSTIFLLQFLQFIYTKKIRKDLLIISLLIIGAALIAILAPGNFVRSANVNNTLPHNNIFRAIYSSLALGTGNILKMIISAPLIPFILLIITVFKKVPSFNQNNYFNKIFPVYTIVVTAAIYFGSIFPGAYAGLGNYGRTLNVSYFIFIIGIVVSIYHLLVYYLPRYSSFQNALKKYSTIIQLASLLVSCLFFIPSNNYKTAYSELFSGKTQESLRLMNERDQNLERSRNKDTVLLRYINPSSLATTVYNSFILDKKHEYNKTDLELYYNIKNIIFTDTSK